MKSKKIIGIVGGMGPEAASDLFKKIIKATPAGKDQDHLRIIIDNNTNIPDRTEAITGSGSSPVLEIQNSIKILEAAGANLIAIACNTAHYFFSSLETEKDVELLHMMDQVAMHIKNKYPTVRRVGLLATDGAIVTKLYPQALAKIKLEVISPNKSNQAKLMDAIYSSSGIKAGFYREAKNVLVKISNKLIEEGSDIIIMGCTEIPLALDTRDVQVNLIDATKVLAEAIVEKAFK